jgi:SpoIIAA-like
MKLHTPDGWQTNGTHLIRFEPPNLFLTRSRGDVNKEDMERSYTTMQVKIDEIGPIYWMTNMSEMGRMSGEARRVQGAPGRVFDPANLLGIAVIGSSFHHRVVAQLAIKASRLLRGDKLPLNVEFFTTEGDAREWVETCRKKRAGR